jgi:hypothetical protein
VLIRSRHVVVLLVAASAGSCLAACSGHDSSGPRVLPAVAATHPTPSKAIRPTTAAANSGGGELSAATAVVRHYYRVTNAMRRDMNPHALNALFTSDCQCLAQVLAVRRAAAKGEHYIDHATLHAVKPSIEDRTHAYVLVDLSTSRGGLVRADGSRITSAAPQRHVERVFRLERVGTSWLIYRIEAV